LYIRKLNASSLIWATHRLSLSQCSAMPYRLLGPEQGAVLETSIAGDVLPKVSWRTGNAFRLSVPGSGVVRILRQHTRRRRGRFHAVLPTRLDFISDPREILAQKLTTKPHQWIEDEVALKGDDPHNAAHENSA
jgi:hypothetical protein